MPEVMKLCSVCKQNKPVSEFGPELRRSTKLKYLCRSCDSERHRIRYLNPKTHEEWVRRREKESIRAKAHFAAKRTRGECFRCSAQAAVGYTLCETHRLAAQKNERDRRERLARIAMAPRELLEKTNGR